MSKTQNQILPSEPPPAIENKRLSRASTEDMADSPSRTSSVSSTDSIGERRSRSIRPKLPSRQSSGPIVVSRDHPNIERNHEVYDENDARSMSPTRSRDEVDRLEEGARRALMEQARMLQANLLSIIERVEAVKAEHEKLEGGNRFLQSYIGELMQTSNITATGKGKGKSGKSK